MLPKEKIQALPDVNCWGYDNDGRENCRGYTSGSGHAAVGAVIRMFWAWNCLRRGRRLFLFASCQGRRHAILNLEQGQSVPDWGRMIFYVADVDAFWEYLRGKGFNPENPRDASWGERYFHMPDPDGHGCSLLAPYSEQRYHGRHFAALEES